MAYYSEEQWLEWVDRLATHDFVVIDNFLTAGHLQVLLAFFDKRLSQEVFKKASVGAGTDAQVVAEIRGDYTYWLDRQIDIELSGFFILIDELMDKLNQYCFLSVKDSEFHLAFYPKGSYYNRHIDQFGEKSNRLISVILYLNKAWRADHGGALKTFISTGETLIEPILNRVVIFKSADVPHEVLITHKGRASLSGWLLHKPHGLVYSLSLGPSPIRFPYR